MVSKMDRRDGERAVLAATEVVGRAMVVVVVVVVVMLLLPTVRLLPGQ